MRFFTPPSTKPLISLTPLIDVVFILLIFFMLASSFLDWRTIEMTVSTAGEKSQSTDLPPLIVKTFQDGTVELDGGKHSVLNFVKKLKEEDTDLDQKTILLKPQEEVSLQTSVNILQSFIQSGITKVSFYTPLTTGGK